MNLPDLPDGYSWRYSEYHGSFVTTPKAECGHCGAYELRGYYNSNILFSDKLSVFCDNCTIEATLRGLKD